LLNNRPVNIFEECLSSWDLGDDWRPFVERLAERVADWPVTAAEPDDFSIEAPLDIPWREGLLVWVHLGDACLGAQIDRTGLRCGDLNDLPGDRLATWFTSSETHARNGKSLESLADEMLDWFARRPRAVDHGER
jgi:hypothetical protein